MTKSHKHFSALMMAALLTACESMSGDGAFETGDQIAFLPCEDAASPMLEDSQCATLIAPLHPGAEGSETINLFVRKFPASEPRVGEFWMLAGGPGEPGTSYYTRIQTFRDAFPGHDVFIPDHRGTGRSSRLCAGESMDSAGGTALTGEEFGTCFGEIWENAERTVAYSMTNAAYDLDHLITELGGEGARYIYGVSYGTGYALRYSQLRTQRVDGLILDSLVSALDDETYDISRRSQTNDLIGQRVITACAAEPECNGRFEGGVAQAFEGLIASINAGERSDLTELVPGGNFKHSLGMMLDTPQSRALIPDLIALAIERPEALPDFYANQVTPALSAFTEVGTLDHSAFSITLAGLIGESETNRRPDMTAQAVSDEERALDFTSSLTTVQTYTNMPVYSVDEYFAAPYRDLPPVLVLQGDMDPKTPLEGALGHIEDMEQAGREVHLTLVEQAPHAIWFLGFDCMISAVSAFTHGEAVQDRCTVDAG